MNRMFFYGLAMRIKRVGSTVLHISVGLCLLVCIQVFFSSAATASWHSKFDKDIKTFNKGAVYKAWATTNSSWTYGHGFSINQSSLAEAERKALAMCRGNRKLHTRWKVPAGIPPKPSRIEDGVCYVVQYHFPGGMRWVMKDHITLENPNPQTRVTWQGNNFIGDTLFGIPHGQGTFRRSDGEYVGGWKDGKMYGRGTFTWVSGDKYIGEWKDGKKHGRGTFTWVNGMKYVGEWRNDSQWEGAEYDPSEEIAGTWSSGIFTKSVSQTAILIVKSSLTDANVYIDNTYKGKTELEINLPPNYYSIRVSKPGYHDFRERVELKENMVLWASLSKIKETKPKEDRIVAAASGTGFFVSRSGHVITNHHVIEDCKAVKVSFKGDEVQARVLATDKFNDLAILKTNLTPSTVYSVANEDAQLLDDVVIAGYPLGKRISAAVKTSKGSVTSLAGYGDNYSEFQTDAAMNQGNSGGPIMDQKGNVVGVAVAAYGKKEGVESFNFGIKASTLKTFASSNNLTFLPPNNRDLSNRNLGQLITNATLYIECWMTVAQIKQMIDEAENRKAFFSEFD